MIILLLTGILAGLIEASAGGSGLVSLPALMLMGYQPIEALATSKFQFSFGAATAIYKFSSAGLIHWRQVAPLLLTATLAGALGAHLLSELDTELIALIVPFLLIAIAIYLARSSHISDVASKPRLSWSRFALLVVPVIAFYDGFFGVGSASLYVAAFVALLGMNARMATANTKLVDFASGIAALLVLALKGHVLLQPGLVLGMGQILGSYFGASLVLRWGARWVRPLVVIVSIGLSIDLFRRHWPAFVALLHT
ncbi:MAG: TSUP family transporter [Oligoflexia bacterium]|nr:TSUP family transporter [Oligoflexia bacterium]